MIGQKIRKIKKEKKGKRKEIQRALHLHTIVQIHSTSQFVMLRLNFFISLRRDSNSVLASTVCQRLEKESRFLVIIDDTGVFNTRLSPKSPSCRNTKENSLQSLGKFRFFWNNTSHTLYSVKQIKFHWHITHYFLDLLS